MKMNFPNISKPFPNIVKPADLPNNEFFKKAFCHVLNFCFESSDTEKSNDCLKNVGLLGKSAWFGKRFVPNFCVLLIRVKEVIKNKGLFSLIYLFFLFLFSWGGYYRARESDSYFFFYDNCFNNGKSIKQSKETIR